MTEKVSHVESVDVGKQDLSTYTNWIKSAVELAPGTEVIHTETGLGLQADVQLAKDKEEPAVRVPHKLVLTSTRIKELAQEDKQLYKWIGEKNLAENEVLHRGLLYLWLEAPDSSPWRQYLNNLPKDVRLPFALSVREMEKLDFAGVSIMYPALLRRVAIERAYLKFKKLGLRDVSLEEWLLPHQWISSRALSHPKTGESCEVPVLDLANHSSTRPNVRYDVDENGDFLLLKVPYEKDADRPESGHEELLLDYGERSSAEFVYNYGFLPEGRTSDDFDEVFRAFDPGSERVRDVLDPSRTIKDLSPGVKIDLAHAYDALLDFFGEEYPQVLRVVRLPKYAETKETSRYKFHNNFLMALASKDELEVREVDGRSGLYIGEAELTPTTAFDVVMKTKNDEIVQRVRQLVCRLCRVFAAQLAEVSCDEPVIKELAERESQLYEQYASTMGSPDL